MSADKDMSKPREDSGKARRTYASLKECRGFNDDHPVSNGFSRLVSIAPMDARTYWRHVGSGKWNAADAQYEIVEEMP